MFEDGNFRLAPRLRLLLACGERAVPGRACFGFDLANSCGERLAGSVVEAATSKVGVLFLAEFITTLTKF